MTAFAKRDARVAELQVPADANKCATQIDIENDAIEDNAISAALLAAGEEDDEAELVENKR